MNYKLSEEKIYMIMAAKIMTLKDLTDRAGINPSYYTQLLKKDKVRPATAGKIAAALGVSVEEIIVKGA